MAQSIEALEVDKAIADFKNNPEYYRPYLLRHLKRNALLGLGRTLRLEEITALLVLPSTQVCSNCQRLLPLGMKGSECSDTVAFFNGDTRYDFSEEWCWFKRSTLTKTEEFTPKNWDFVFDAIVEWVENEFYPNPNLVRYANIVGIWAAPKGLYRVPRRVVQKLEQTAPELRRWMCMFLSYYPEWGFIADVAKQVMVYRTSTMEARKYEEMCFVNEFTVGLVQRANALAEAYDPEPEPDPKYAQKAGISMYTDLRIVLRQFG